MKVCVLTGLFLTLAASGAVVDVSPVEGNATPAVQAAVKRLGNGGILRFAKGEYHFFEDGAGDVFLASAGSSTGMKKVVFHLEDLKDVTAESLEAKLERALALRGDRAVLESAVERLRSIEQNNSSTLQKLLQTC